MGDARAGDSTEKTEAEGLRIVCDVMVDYLNQSRKPTRAKRTDVLLQRDEFGNIILAIGTQKQRQTFKVEDVTKIYAPKPTDTVKDKASLEIELPGGSICNIILQSITPVDLVKPFLDICHKVITDPYNAHKIELHQN